MSDELSMSMLGLLFLVLGGSFALLFATLSLGSMAKMKLAEKVVKKVAEKKKRKAKRKAKRKKKRKAKRKKKLAKDTCAALASEANCDLSVR